MKTSTLKLSRLSAVLAVTLFMSLSSYAQLNLGLSLHGAIPMNEFEAAGYEPDMGFSADVLSSDLHLGPLAFQGGVHFDYTGGGREKMEVVLSVPENANAKMKINNESVGMHAIARLLTPDGHLRLYVDGLLGSRLFNSYETINLRGAYPGYEDETTDAVLKSWTLSYGAAVGLQFQLTNGISLDLRTTYMKGGGADFVDLQSVSNPKVGRVNYDAVRAPSTDMVMVQVGFNIKLQDMGCAPSRSEISTGCCSPSYGRQAPPVPVECGPVRNRTAIPKVAPTPRTPSTNPTPAPRSDVNLPRRTGVIKN